MDLVTIVFGLLALAGIVGVVSLLLGRQALRAALVREQELTARAREDLAADRARHEAEIVRLDAARQALQAEHQAVNAQLDESTGEARRLAVLTAELRERIEAQSQREREFRAEVVRREAELRERLDAAFAAAASKALSANTQAFLNLAEQRLRAQQQEGQAELEQRRLAVEHLVQPLAESLRRTDEQLRNIERSWGEDKGKLRESLAQVMLSGETLRAETGKLVRALREPKTRGRYGEIQLRRVAELAGMRGYCDFVEQEATKDADGNLLRPDMIIKLPGGRELAVDSKANLQPYLEALEAPSPEAVEERLQAFADGVATQALALARKGYWRHYERSPEFVVMFVPGDQFVDAALSKRPDLLETAMEQRVILASPSTLIALLRAVAVGFQEQRLADEARELRAHGAELHKRFAAALAHVSDLGTMLERAQEHYNKFVGSYQQRLEPTLRRFEDAGVKSGAPLPEIKELNVKVRDLPPALVIPDALPGLGMQR